MNCLVIDDNGKTSEALGAVLKGFGFFEEVLEAVEPYQIRSYLSDKEQAVEVVFTRLRLWDANIFTEVKKMPVVVFLHGGKCKITDNIATTVPYRLREPFTDFELQQLLTRIRSQGYTEKPNYFFVRLENRYHRYFFRRVEIVERIKMGYVKLFVAGETIVLNDNLSDWLHILPPDEFIRVSDTLILPAHEVGNIVDNHYFFKGRRIALTYRFAKAARKEMAMLEASLE